MTVVQRIVFQNVLWTSKPGIILILYFKPISLVAKTAHSKRSRSCPFLSKILGQNGLNIPL